MTPPPSWSTAVPTWSVTPCVPTLDLVGRDDNLTVPAFSRALAGMIPGARLKVIPGGHDFTIERWEDFNRAVLSFLRGVKR